MHQNLVLLGAFKNIIEKNIFRLTNPNIQKFHLKATQQFSFFGPVKHHFRITIQTLPSSFQMHLKNFNPALNKTSVVHQGSSRVES